MSRYIIDINARFLNYKRGRAEAGGQASGQGGPCPAAWIYYTSARAIKHTRKRYYLIDADFR